MIKNQNIKLFFALFVIIIIYYLTKCITDFNINEIYYINLDSEKERNEKFINNYKNNSLNIPVHRISGIVSESGNDKLTKGELGCALSHIKTLNKISNKKKGWYLICEDDCTGDFRTIKPKIENIIKLHPFLMHINLYSPNNYIKFSPSIGACCMTAYLVTPLGARIDKFIIEQNLNKKPCDTALFESLSHLFISVRFNNVLYPDETESSIQKINKLS